MLDDFSYDFNKGDRIGIVGRNGVGKVCQSMVQCIVLEYRSNPLDIAINDVVDLCQNLNRSTAARFWYH